LKIVPVGMRWLRMPASAGLFDSHRVVSEHERSLALSRRHACAPTNVKSRSYLVDSSLASLTFADSSSR
jgi:hypothetical protein